MDNFTSHLTTALSAPSGDTATHTALVSALTQLELTGPGWSLLVRPEAIEAMRSYVSKREQDGSTSTSGRCYASAFDNANREYRIQLGEDRPDYIWTHKKTVFDLAARIKALNNGG